MKSRTSSKSGSVTRLNVFTGSNGTSICMWWLPKHMESLIILKLLRFLEVPGFLFLLLSLVNNCVVCIHLCIRYKVPYNVISEDALEESSSRRAALESALRDVLFQIVRFVNDKKDHIPSISNYSEVLSFPYEITIPRFVLPYLLPTAIVKNNPWSDFTSFSHHFAWQIYFVKELLYESPGDTFYLGVFRSSSDSSFGWHADVFKRMLQTGHPTMLSWLQ